jgi:hypothetical protein
MGEAVMRGVRVSTIAIAAAMASFVGAPSALGAEAPPVLTGDGQGTFKVTQTNIADAGTERPVRGHGDFSIGAATIRGVVSAPGFVYEGACHARFRLVTDTGAIKVVGYGKVRSRDGDKPICDGHHFRFRFHTTKARGDLADASYKGVGVFDLEDASTDDYDHGTFTLVLRVPRD